MFHKSIPQIYYYLVSLISLILIIIGFYNATTFTINTLSYDKYPLRYAGGDDCNYPYPGKPPYYSFPNERFSEYENSAQQTEIEKNRCLVRVENERKQHRLDDIKNAIVFLTAGAFLFAIHFPQAQKASKTAQN